MSEKTSPVNSTTPKRDRYFNVTVAFPPEFKGQLKRRANEQHRTVSNLVTVIVDDFLKSDNQTHVDASVL